MSQVHGVGPTVALAGAFVAFMGVVAWMRFSGDHLRDYDRRPRWSAFADRVVRVGKRSIAVGVLIAVIGLIIWWASA